MSTAHPPSDNSRLESSDLVSSLVHFFLFRFASLNGSTTVYNPYRSSIVRTVVVPYMTAPSLMCMICTVQYVV